MTTTRRPARLRATDSIVVCAAATIAFACFMIPYYPDITRYELWSSTAKMLLAVNGLVLAGFAAGCFWVGRRR